MAEAESYYGGAEPIVPEEVEEGELRELRSLSPQEFNVLARELFGKRISDQDRRHIVHVVRRQPEAKSVQEQKEIVQRAILSVTGIKELPNISKGTDFEGERARTQWHTAQTGDLTRMEMVAGMDVREDRALLEAMNEIGREREVTEGEEKEPLAAK